MSVNRSIAALRSGRQTLLQPWLQSLGARPEEWACVELPQLQVLRRGDFCRCVRATVAVESRSGM